MIINIINEPEEAKEYEFIVARPVGESFLFIGMYENGAEAEAIAKRANGIIFHNCRISGRVRRDKYKISLRIEKEFVATDEYEAEEKFYEWFQDVSDHLPDTEYWKLEKVER